ncbi:MAG: TRAP transporter substrate-binding protein [Burkholderiales bacterium]
MAMRSNAIEIDAMGARGLQRGCGKSGLVSLVAAALLSISGMAPAQTILKMSTTLPPNNPVVGDFFEPWAKKVNVAAGSEFQIQVINGPTIANATNVWDRTASGVVEIGFGILGAVSRPFPKSTIIGLPLLVEENQLAAASVSLWRLYSSGLTTDEFKDVKPIALFGTPVQGISSKQPIRRLEDMKGLKVRAADKTVADVVTALGGAPISVPAIEVYQALSQGVVGASVAGFVLVTAFKLTEVVKNHLEGLPLGAPAGFIVMNPQAYEKLSPKGKEILNQFIGETLSREFGTYFMNEGIRNKESVRKMPDHTFFPLTGAEKTRWEQAAQPVIRQWSSSTPNGEKILGAFRAEIQKGGK